MLVKDFADSIARRLVDAEDGYEFTHWTETDVIDAIRYAVGIVAMNRKGEFTREVDVLLRPGVQQRLGEGCKEMVGLVGTIDSRGEVVAPAVQTAYKSSTMLHRPICQSTRSDGHYVVRSWQRNLADTNGFSVQPPVPRGVDVRVRALCFSVPPVRSMDDELGVAEQHLPILSELVMYYAYSRDIESVASRDRATHHWRVAVELMRMEVMTPAEVSGFVKETKA